MKMKKYLHPTRDQWAEITVRPHIDLSELNATVSAILDDIRNNGDEAIRRYEQKFDHADLKQLAVSPEEIEQAWQQTPSDLRDALVLAHSNIAKFHEAQRHDAPQVETSPGVTCWQRSVPIQRVGLYIPGGTAPLFSTVLMLATPAKIAGCPDIVLCTPPAPDGSVNPAILAAAHVAGVSRVFRIGGVQAIGAMAYGTESVPKVYKIFGPGNQYVMAAKQLVGTHDVAIDMPAGPSEVCVVADGMANPSFVAADLLSQAEHGRDSQVLLITDSEPMLKQVEQEIAQQLPLLPRKEIAAAALQNSKLVLVGSTIEAIELANVYAPEHLILATTDCDELAQRVVNAGSVFIGAYACESAGDYASGTNHTLPTHGYARAYNGVNLDSYMRKITFQHITPEGISTIGPAVVCMAENERLEGHANAMRLRMEQIESKK